MILGDGKLKEMKTGGDDEIHQECGKQGGNSSGRRENQPGTGFFTGLKDSLPGEGEVLENREYIVVSIGI